MSTIKHEYDLESGEPISAQDQRYQLEKFQAGLQIGSQHSPGSDISSVTSSNFPVAPWSPVTAEGQLSPLSPYNPNSQPPPPSYVQQSLCSPNRDHNMILNDVSKHGIHDGTILADFSGMPLSKLGFESRRQMGLMLDPEVVGAANWKTLADHLGFSYQQIKGFELERHKTQCVLERCNMINPRTTVGQLCNILENDMQRQDVVTDMHQWFSRDFRALQDRARMTSNSSSLCSPNSVQFSAVTAPSAAMATQNSMTPLPIAETQVSLCPIVVQEDQVTSSAEPSGYPGTSKLSAPLPGGCFPEALPIKKTYDAFVLYDNQDRDFILKEFLPRIEEDECISLFIPDRDLDPGVQAYDAQLQMMIANCPKLVVILSDAFLRSSQRQWALNVGISLDPAARQKKIIPVIYKPINEPNILSGINACDRTRVLEDSWFWKSLVRSLVGSRQAHHRTF